MFITPIFKILPPASGAGNAAVCFSVSPGSCNQESCENTAKLQRTGETGGSLQPRVSPHAAAWCSSWPLLLPFPTGLRAHLPHTLLGCPPAVLSSMLGVSCRVPTSWQCHCVPAVCTVRAVPSAQAHLCYWDEEMWRVWQLDTHHPAGAWERRIRHKISCSFYCWILFLNAVENTAGGEIKGV